MPTPRRSFARCGPTRGKSGCLPLRSIAEGKLIFQSRQPDGGVKEEKRLPKGEEKVVLQAMEQTMLQRSLCLRQDDQLVFPSHCGRERPVVQEGPALFVSYRFQGFLDDIYATLVVKLAHCGAFPLRELWRDAADFGTLADRKRVGIKLTRDADGQGEMEVYCEHGVTAAGTGDLCQLHPRAPADQGGGRRPVTALPVSALRHASEEPRSRHEAAGRAGRGGRHRVRRVRAPRAAVGRRWRNGSPARKCGSRCDRCRPPKPANWMTAGKPELLVAEVSARIRSADQKCFEIPGTEDEGLEHGAGIHR